MPFDRHVSHQRLFELHAAAIAHDMGPRQGRLLEGLSPAFIATIPDDGLPVDRLLTTLHRLNVIERLEDGSVPLHVWLRNAFALTHDEAFAVGRAERERTVTGAAVNTPDDPKVQAIRAKYKERAALAEQGRTVADVIAEIVRLKKELYTTSDLGPKVLLSGSRYELLELLGKGGVGAVWKAYDDVCKRHVAVKVLLPEHGHAVLARFRRGARCMSELEHPNVVRVVQSEGVEERDGVKRWFFVMEHLPGGTLKAAVLDKRMRPEEALRRVIEVGSGLSHAHAKGMIHRDVTPDNVVLAANGAAKLTDFDLVRAEDTTGLTKTGQTFGKVMYVAPELWNGAKDADTRADVYALGMMAMFAAHGAELPPEAMAFRDMFIHGLNVEEGVRAVVRKAVAWRPEDRYGSVEALCCELNRALDLPVVTISRAADPDAETLPDPGPTPPIMKKPAEPEVLFSWLHLSDVHVGHPNVKHRSDQALVLDALCQDLASLAKRFTPLPNAILVTGDIAFSGKKDQYDKAKTWLTETSTLLGFSPEHIFVVPGNHDVDRTVDKDDRSVGRLVRGLREGDDDLDDILANAGDRALLERRMREYLSFAGGFPHLQEPDPLFWVNTLTAKRGLRVRLVGLNTALLAAGEDDKGKLRLGKTALARTLTKLPDGELLLVLTHHPLREGWLADQVDAGRQIAKSATIHLFGHVHEADSVEARTGAGTGVLRITAGAVHGDKLPEGMPASHGYNIASVMAFEGGAIKLRIWPRTWSEKKKEFIQDKSNTTEDEPYAEHALPGVKLA